MGVRVPSSDLRLDKCSARLLLALKDVAGDDLSACDVLVEGCPLVRRHFRDSESTAFVAIPG